MCVSQISFDNLHICQIVRCPPGLSLVHHYLNEGYCQYIWNYEPEFTEEEMQNMTTKTPVNNELRKNVCAVVRRNMSNQTLTNWNALQNSLSFSF
jgi:hypothetical protein